MSTIERIASAFSANLRKYRTKRGLTMTELARKAKDHTPHVSDLEGGKVIPSLPTIARLADALKIEPAELLRTRP